MAQPTAVLVSGIAHKIPVNVTIVPFTFDLTGSTNYATASAGITVDVSTLTALFGGSGASSLYVNDIVGAFGYYTTGDSVVPTVTKSSNVPTGAFTVRLFNGETETADGAKTGTLTLFVMFDRGSRSYNT